MRSKPWKIWLAAPFILLPLPILLVAIISWSSSDPKKPKPPSPTEQLYKAAGQEAPKATGQTSTGVPPGARSAAYVSSREAYSNLSYSGLLDLVRRRRVKEALIDTTSSSAYVLQAKSKQVIKVTIPPDASDSLTSRLAASGARVDVINPRPSGGGTRWGQIVLIIIIVAAFAFAMRMLVMRQNPAGGIGGSKDPTKLRSDAELGDDSGVRFSDVAGCDEVVAEVSEFVDFLKDPERFHRLGAKMPSGLLLYGPPGTGKTLVAKALAGEAEVPFFAVSGSEFVEKYVGVGASRVRELFQKAKKSDKGAVVFIDEIDAIGRSRDGADNNSERDQTLNELLAQMDGFATTDRVVVVAATNRKDVLDSALLRPGRLGRQVRVGTPDSQGRLEILSLHSEGKPFGSDVDLEALAETTAGCSGAELADMLNEAAIMAARDGRSKISHTDLVEGQLRAIAGPERRSSMTEEEREMVAFHEAGHVLCAELCDEHEKAQRATIRPRGQAGGLALYGQVDRALHSTRYLHERLICALGGRAAEWVRYGKVSTGAANDLQQANAVARQAVQELGFSPRAGQMIISSGGQGVRVSDSTRQVVDREVERMVAEAYAEAVKLLQEHSGALESLAYSLLGQEDLDRLEIVAAIGLDNAPPRVRRPAPQMAPQTVPVLHQKRAPKVRSRLRGAGVKASRRLANAFKRPRNQHQDKPQA